MAKVIAAFRERHHGYRRYNPGDEYPEDMPERVAYLAKLGYVEPSAPQATPKRRKKGADTDAAPDA